MFNLTWEGSAIALMVFFAFVGIWWWVERGSKRMHARQALREMKSLDWGTHIHSGVHIPPPDVLAAERRFQAARLSKHGSIRWSGDRSPTLHREVITQAMDPPASLDEVKAAITSYMHDDYGSDLRRLSGINEIQLHAARAQQAFEGEISGDGHACN